jgi:hypothetical protein
MTPAEFRELLAGLIGAPRTPALRPAAKPSK